MECVSAAAVSEGRPVHGCLLNVEARQPGGTFFLQQVTSLSEKVLFHAQFTFTIPRSSEGKL